jgi:hypothetical protein
VSSVNRDDPQVTTTLAAGCAGRLREMSASSRPLTSATPGSEMSAATSTRAETS